MFSLSYTSPDEIQGAIAVPENRWPMGIYTDPEGFKWHIGGHIRNTVLACPLGDTHPYYYDTSGAQYSSWSQRWRPYERANYSAV